MGPSAVPVTTSDDTVSLCAGHNDVPVHSLPRDVDLGSRLLLQPDLKVIRKFFLKHNMIFRWHLGDYEKHIFFPFEGL